MSRLGVALIGYGRWGENLARVLAASPRCELKAIADIDAGRRQIARARYPGVPAMSVLDDVLGLPGVAAVAIATPPLSLAGLARTAIANRRHALVEKPGATTAREASARAAAADRAGVVVMVDLTPLFSPLQDAMAATLADGAAGTPVHWRAERTNAGRGQPGIDVMRDLAVHDLAVLDALVAPGPQAVAAAGASLAGRLFSATLRLHYRNGLAAEVVASWIGAPRTRRTTIIGTRAALFRDDAIGGDGLQITRLAGGFSHDAEPPSAIAAVPRAGSPGEPLARVIDAFVDAILQGRAPATGMATAARLLTWIEAAERSIAAAGKPVEIAAMVPA
jgi:predicted dehydrogenase